MAKVEDVWLQNRIDRLEKRLQHQRDLDKLLIPNSILKTMNDRAVIDMEFKLFTLRKQAAATALTRTRKAVA